MAGWPAAGHAGGRGGQAATTRIFTPATLTTTGPVPKLTPDGTVVTMVVSLQLLTVARVPLKLTVLFP